MTVQRYAPNDEERPRGTVNHLNHLDAVFVLCSWSLLEAGLERATFASESRRRRTLGLQGFQE
jgi:hypothetical protein